jgi:hypothetical protein
MCHFRQVLGTFVEVAESAYCLRHVCLSFRISNSGYTGKVSEILYWRLSLKSAEKIQMWLKPDKDIGHFA